MSEETEERNANQTALLKQVETAFAIRLEANERFRSGDTQEALRLYYHTLLNLKGLDTRLPKTNEGPKISEIETTKDSKQSGDASVQTATANEVTEEPLDVKIKQTIGLTYCNMAACHVKLENWAKALKFAQDALAVDGQNRKAKFREAQARLGLGEIVLGRRMLEDLDKAQSDSTIQAVLKTLDIQEKARDKKAKDQFKGFLEKQNKQRKTNDQATIATPHDPAEGDSGVVS